MVKILLLVAGIVLLFISLMFALFELRTTIKILTYPGETGLGGLVAIYSVLIFFATLFLGIGSLVLHFKM